MLVLDDEYGQDCRTTTTGNNGHGLPVMYTIYTLPKLKVKIGLYVIHL